MPEHYVTYFDHNFLLQGLALHESLRRHQPDSMLWVLCLDEKAETQLKALCPKALKIISMSDVESPELLAAKKNRSRSEYIFTLTPFVFEFVFARDDTVSRVTYLDADIYFFGDPMLLLNAFLQSARSVLVTKHAYSPQYEYLAKLYGTFCVQFLTVTRTPSGLAVIRAWQGQCLEDCTASRYGTAKVFGDQKYLEDWPQKYPDSIYIVPDHMQTLAPWNVSHFQLVYGTPYFPVLYHFQSYRIFHRNWIQLCFNFDIHGAEHIYEAYLKELSRQSARLKACGIPCPVVPFRGDPLWLLRLIWRRFKGSVILKRYSLCESVAET